MIDTHVHFTHERFNVTSDYSYLTFEDDRYVVQRGYFKDVLQKTHKLGVTAVIEPAIGLDSNERILALYEKHKGFFYPAVGVHPNEAFFVDTDDKKAFAKAKKKLLTFVKAEGVVAIGEAGLDYKYRCDEVSIKRQIAWFRYQLTLARIFRLPLILHIRRMADNDALKILKRRAAKLHGGVVHCFRGDAETAMKYVNLGFHLGIGGALLHNSEDGNNIKEAVKMVPLERILLETDSPYVLPEVPTPKETGLTNRTRNTPIIIHAVAKEIARLKNRTTEEVIAACDNNAKTLFRLK